MTCFIPPRSIASFPKTQTGQPRPRIPKRKSDCGRSNRSLIESLEVRQLLSAAVVGTGNGLLGQYYDNQDFTDLKITRVDPKVAFDWSSSSPDPAINTEHYSVRWTGQVQAEYSQKYTFYTISDDGVRLWVNGKLLIDNWTDHAATQNSGTIALQAGQKYDIEMDFYQDRGRSVAKLAWSSHSQKKQAIPQTQLYAASTTIGTDPSTTDPTSGTPVTSPPVTIVPVTNTPVTSTPATNTPVTSTPVTGTPVTSTPVTSTTPVTNTPVANPPVTNPPVTSDPSASGPPIPGNWSMIFNDQFTGQALSPAWSNSLWGKNYGGTAKVFNGTLQLSATDASTSALINTENSAQPFSFTYGYAQVKMQVPKGQGIWPAFWMLPMESYSPDASAGEIDVYEGQGNVPNVDFATYHWGNPDNQIGNSTDAGVDLSQGYHTYGVDWEKDHLTFYLDGNAIETITSQQAAICAGPMYLLLDVWLGGWSGGTDSTTPFPATMNVQSVQVWQTSSASLQVSASITMSDPMPVAAVVNQNSGSASNNTLSNNSGAAKNSVIAAIGA
jgi:hypothetical protein